MHLRNVRAPPSGEKREHGGSPPASLPFPTVPQRLRDPIWGPDIKFYSGIQSVSEEGLELISKK